MLGDSVTFGDSLIVTVFSMVIVFISLLIISYIIDGLKAISTKNDRKANGEKSIDNELEKEELFNISHDEDESEIVAVIAAAIAASTGVNVSDLKINSIKRVPQMGSVWSKVGRQEQIYNRL